MTVGRLTQLVLECDDAERLARFWREVLDLLVDDLHDAALFVEKAGARALTDVLDPGPQAWRIYADPAGHPFCLVSVPQ